MKTICLLFTIGIFFLSIPCRSQNVISQSGGMLSPLELFGTWSEASNQGLPSFFGSTAHTINGKVYVFGGSNDDSINGITFPNTVEVFDPGTNSWSIIPSNGQFSGRYFGGSVLYNNKVYVIGGQGGTGAGGYIGDIEIFDPSTNQWTTLTPSGKFIRRKMFACAELNGKIYVMGGFIDPTDLVDIWAGFEVYDIPTNTWSDLGTYNDSGVWGPTACSLNNKIYLFGGYKASPLSVYDPVPDSWTTPDTLGTFTGREDLTSCAFNGKIIALGGADFNYNSINASEAFDPTDNTWSKISTTGTFTPRYGLSSAVVGNSIYTIGGTNTTFFGNPNIYNTNEELTFSSAGVTGSKLASDELTITPNPTEGKVVIDRGLAGNSQPERVYISVSNSLGQTMLKAESDAAAFQLDLSSLPSGIYFARMSSNRGILTRSIVKK
jgi:N-acetylneuraminic acid mutarotase